MKVNQLFVCSKVLHHDTRAPSMSFARSNGRRTAAAVALARWADSLRSLSGSVADKITHR